MTHDTLGARGQGEANADFTPRHRLMGSHPAPSPATSNTARPRRQSPECISQDMMPAIVTACTSPEHAVKKTRRWLIWRSGALCLGDALFSVLALSHSEGQIVKSNSEVKFGFNTSLLNLYNINCWWKWKLLKGYLIFDWCFMTPPCRKWPLLKVKTDKWLILQWVQRSTFYQTCTEQNVFFFLLYKKEISFAF